MPTNSDRVGIASEMLNALPDRAENGEQENITDALTNLRHFCQQEGFDFEQAVRMSQVHWEAEK